MSALRIAATASPEAPAGARIAEEKPRIDTPFEAAFEALAVAFGRLPLRTETALHAAAAPAPDTNTPSNDTDASTRDRGDPSASPQVAYEGSTADALAEAAQPRPDWTAPVEPDLEPAEKPAAKPVRATTKTHARADAEAKHTAQTALDAPKSHTAPREAAEPDITQTTSAAAPPSDATTQAVSVAAPSTHHASSLATVVAASVLGARGAVSSQAAAPTVRQNATLAPVAPASPTLAIQTRTSATESTAELAITHPELGAVQIAIRLSGGAVTVRLEAAGAAAQQQLQLLEPGLRNALRARGVLLRSLRVKAPTAHVPKSRRRGLHTEA